MTRVSIALAMIMILSACASPQPTSAPDIPEAVTVTVAPPPESTPTAKVQSVATIQVPDCTPPAQINAPDATYEMSWVVVTAENDRNDYSDGTETYHYQLVDGMMLFWVGNDRKHAPTFLTSKTDQGSTFAILMGNKKGPIFFYICATGGMFIDDSRATDKPQGPSA